MSTLLRSGRGRLVVVLVLLLAIGAAAGARLLLRPAPTTFSAVFSQTVGLYRGSDVRILGLAVGRVTKITPQGKDVRVEMTLDSGQKVAPGTGAVIISPTIVSDRYVQLTEPWTSGPTLASHTVIPQSRTETPVEIDALYKSLDDLATTLGPDGANSDGSLSKLIQVGAANLDGNGQKINDMLREFGKATGALSDSDQDFFKTVSNFKELNDTLVANDREVAKVNQQFADVTQYLADDRGDLQAALKNLAAALAVLDDFIRDNRDNLKGSVDKLIGPTQTLVRQRTSLEEAIRVLPVALQNFLNTYNAGSGVIDGRADLNELGVWLGQNGAARTSGQPTPQAKQAAPSTGSTSTGTTRDLPPVLLPGLDQSGAGQ